MLSTVRTRTGRGSREERAANGRGALGSMRISLQPYLALLTLSGFGHLGYGSEPPERKATRRWAEKFQRSCFLGRLFSPDVPCCCPLADSRIRRGCVR